MGKLYRARQQIEKYIFDHKLELFKTKGSISLACGFALSMITEHTPDDDAKLDKIREVAQKVIGIHID